MAVAAVTIIGFAGACGSSYSSPSPSPSPTPTGGTANVTVTIKGNLGAQSYVPSPVTVQVGQTIAWQNGDAIGHTATQDSGGFNTGTIAPGATSSPAPMNTAGTFTYHCSIHPGMVGTITVH